MKTHDIPIARPACHLGRPAVVTKSFNVIDHGKDHKPVVFAVVAHGNTHSTAKVERPMPIWTKMWDPITEKHYYHNNKNANDTSTN